MRSENRDALLAAMETLLDAAKQDPSVDLSIERLAEFADVSRATAYRDPDLKKEWQKRVAKHLLQEGRPKKSLTASQRAARRDASVRALRSTIAIMANHIQALTLTVSRLEAERKTGRELP